MRANAATTRSISAADATRTWSPRLVPRDLALEFGRAGVEDAPGDGVVEELLKHVHQPRVEPASAPPARHRVRGWATPQGVEHLDRLGKAHDAAEQRDRVGAQAARPAVSVPVLVERADRLGRVMRHAQQLRDLGAALAAQADELALEVALAGEPQDAAHP